MMSEQRPASRALRRQLARERYPIFRRVPDVRVIELRRREHQRDDEQDDRRGDEPVLGVSVDRLWSLAPAVLPRFSPDRRQAIVEITSSQSARI